MIPPRIAEAAGAGGWKTTAVSHRRGTTWILLFTTGLTIIKRDRWRHTSARVHRGNALSAILPTQAAIAAFLSHPQWKIEA